MNKAVKRRAIICSLLTIALCISLVAGVSFALFHASTSGSVQINAGKISLSATIDKDSIVSQKDKGGKDAITARVDTEDGSKLIIENASSDYSVNFNIKVNNESTIPVKYRIKFIGDGNLTLFDAMQIKINSETKTKTSYKHLSKEVDDTVNVSVSFEKFDVNAVRGASCELSYVIEAVQANASVETESSVISVKTPHEFIWALDEALADSGKTIKLIDEIDEIDLRGSLPRSAAGGNVRINGNGKVIKLDNSLFEELNGGSYTFENITFNNPEAQAASRVALMSVRKVVDSGDSSCSGAIAGAIKGGANVTINDCKVKDRNFKGESAGAFVGSVGVGSTVTFKGCSVENSEVKGDGTEGTSTGYFVGKTQGEITFDGCSVDENSSVEKENTASNNYVGNVEASSDGEGETGTGKLPDVKVALADGVYINNGIYEIDSANGLLWLDEQCLNGNCFFGKTVVLINDITDFSGVEFHGIGARYSSAYPNKQFDGTFDGQDHIVKNMTITNLEQSTNNGSDIATMAGFFNGITRNAIVKNVHFDNATVSGHHYVGVVAGYISGEPGACRIENCSVVNSKVSAVVCELTLKSGYDFGDKAGAIVGYFAAQDATIDGCSVSKTTISAYRDVAAICGLANTKTSVINCTIGEGVNIIVDNSHNYEKYTSLAKYDANDFVGGRASDVTDITTGNSGSVESIYEVISEGIILNYRTGEYEIPDAAGLFSLQKLVANGSHFEGETFKLTADIDLTNKKWTPIGGHGDPVCSFRGTFDGNYKTINGISDSLFGCLESEYLDHDITVTVKNLTLTNVNIDTTAAKEDSRSGAIVGEISNTERGTFIFENCSVEGGSIRAWKFAGGLIGMIYTNNGPVTIKNCIVNNVAISTIDSSVGGFIGHTYADVTISDGEASDLIVSCEEDRKDDDGNPGLAKAGKLIGTINEGTVNISGTRVSNVELININAQSPIYEGFIGRNYGTLIIGGKTVLADGLAVDAEGVLEVSNANGLMALLSKTGIKKIAFVKDIDMTGKAWTSFFGEGEGDANNFDANGVTIIGNGHSISNLCAPLISESMADVTIEGLTIKDSTAMAQTTGRVNSEAQGFGAFIQVLNSRTLTLKDCHLVDSKLITTDDTRVGGFAGIIWGDADISNCTVEGCELSAFGAVGGIVAQSGDMGGRTVEISNCTVKETKLHSIDNGDWRVGAIVGSANNCTTLINECTSLDNTLTQSGKTAPDHELYGRIRSGGTLKIDGKTILADGVALNAAGEYEISNANGFVDWFVNEVNVNGNDFANKTVKLVSDIDLTGKTFNGVGRKHVNTYVFCGTFDGDNHTIKGININNKCPDTDGDGKWINGCYDACVSDWDCCAGLFTNLGGTDDVVGTVKNVTIVGAKIVGTHYTGGIVGYAQNGMAIIENCHVIDSEIKSYAVTMNGVTDGGDKAGGIVGYLDCNNTVDGCSVENVTITAYRDIGAIAGFANVGATVKNCTIKDGVVLVVDNSKNYNNITDCEGYCAGNHENGVVGRIDEADIDTVTLENNSGSVSYPEISDGVVLNFSTGEYEISNANGMFWWAAQADGF